jgi:hypothetical protein
LRKLDAATGRELAVGSPALLAGDSLDLGRMVAARHGVWVTLHFGFVHRFDAETGDPISSIQVGWHMDELCADHDAVYVDAENAIVRIDGETGAVSRGEEGQGLAVLAGRLAVGRDKHLDITDAETLETIDQVGFDGYPTDIIASQDAFWVSVTELGDSGPPNTPTEVWRVTPDGGVKLVHSSPHYVRVLPGSGPTLLAGSGTGLLELGKGGQLVAHPYPVAIAEGQQYEHLAYPSAAEPEVVTRDGVLFRAIVGSDSHGKEHLVRWVPGSNEITVLFELHSWSEQFALAP